MIIRYIPEEVVKKKDYGTKKLTQSHNGGRLGYENLYQRDFCRTNLGASPHLGFEPRTSGGRTNMVYIRSTNAPVTPGFMTI
jgi:hypothetical protein